MKELHVTKQNLDELLEAVQDALEKEPHLVVSVKGASVGKWGLARLWYSWMATVAKHMADRGVQMPLLITTEGKNFGVRRFNESDAHLLFTYKFMPVDEEGNRLSWSKSGSKDSRAADKGERFHALRQLEIWATERGITLLKPTHVRTFDAESKTWFIAGHCNHSMSEPMPSKS